MGPLSFGWARDCLDVVDAALYPPDRPESEWDGETCDRCGGEQRIGWAVQNECWNRVVPEKHKMDVLCLECFFEIADERGHDIRLEDFVCMMVATNKELERPVFVEERD